MEAGIVNALLRLARSKAAVSDLDAEHARESSDSTMVVRRREAQFSDFEAIAALKSRSGLSLDSLENWQRIWQRNPALNRTKARLPIGWVQESEDGQIVGYLGSVPLLYQLGDETLMATATTGLVADPAYRSRSLGLVGSFFRQSCDLYLDTTATPAAAKIMLAFKAQEVPQLDYGILFFWVIEAEAFLRATMRKLQVNENLGSIGAFFGSPLLQSDTFLRGRRPRSGSTQFTCRDLGPEQIGDDFQDLWLRKLQEPRRLLAWRTPEVLRWHFLVPNSGRKTCVLACYSNSRLQGYLILVIGRDPNLDLHKATVADLIAAADDPAVIRELLAVAYDFAKKERCDVLELLGFPQEIRRVCEESRPHRRAYPACPFLYKTGRTELRDVLIHEKAWYACPFDGDATLSA